MAHPEPYDPDCCECTGEESFGSEIRCAKGHKPPHTYCKRHWPKDAGDYPASTSWPAPDCNDVSISCDRHGPVNVHKMEEEGLFIFRCPDCTFMHGQVIIDLPYTLKGQSFTLPPTPNK